MCVYLIHGVGRRTSCVNELSNFLTHPSLCWQTVATHSLVYSGHRMQWCIAKNRGGYTQWGLAKGPKVPCLFMITEVSIRCQKNPYTRVYPPPNTPLIVCQFSVVHSRNECASRSSGCLWLMGIHAERKKTSGDRISCPVLPEVDVLNLVLRGCHPNAAICSI